ncbi:MAG: glycosyltransferase family 2 protein [Prevotellaceae bacterium]|jgi:glycosyltransferase involved in cell wall biosynthesis|nr:glycosyltransferase family 2 protein [Prevotellaceae bacterium]
MINNSQPLISLLVANFNNGKYIAETLQSAVNQTYKNIEIVVIDDASTDNSREIIRSFIAKNPAACIRFFENESNSGGCGGIKNQCIAFSHGDYFAFLDPEDTIEPNSVDVLYAEHVRNGQLGIVYCSHWLCNEQLEPQSISTWVGAIPQGQSHLTSTGGHISAFALCKRADYNKTGGINPTYEVAEDMDLYLKMEEVAPVLFVDQPMYYYRKHDHNASWDYQKRYRNLFWRHKAETAAYIRRKTGKTRAENLTRNQLNRKNFSFMMQMAKFERNNKNYWKSLVYNIKALPYLYAFFS